MKNTLILFIIILSTIPYYSQTDSSVLEVSLKEALEYGRKNSINIKKAILDVEDADREIKQTLAIGLPQVNASADFTNFLIVQKQLLPGGFVGGDPDELIEVQFGTEFNSGASAQLSQMIFNGSYIVGVAASKALATLIEFQKRDTEYSVDQSIKDAYYAVMIGEENRRLLQMNLENTETLYNEINAIYKAGLGSETDVDQIALNLKTIQNLINTMNMQLILSYNLLKYEMGVPFSQDLIISDKVSDLTYENVVQNAIIDNFDVKSNVMYFISAENLKLQELNIKYEKSTSLPQLNGFLSYGANAFSNDFTGIVDGRWYPQSMWGIQLNVPIFSGLERYQKVQRAKINFQKAEIDLENTERSLNLQLVQAESEFNIAKDSYTLSKENLELAQKIFDKTSTKFKEGVSTSLDYAQTERQLIQAQQNLLQSMFDVLKAKTNLEKIYNK